MDANVRNFNNNSEIEWCCLFVWQAAGKACGAGGGENHLAAGMIRPKVARMSEYRGRSQETSKARRHRWMLTELRGIYQAPDLSGFERNMGDLVGKIMTRAGLGDRLAEESVTREWGTIVGSFLAGQSKPVGLRAGVLQVAVLQSSVRYDLERNHKRDILRRLQERFGHQTVRDIRFTPG